MAVPSDIKFTIYKEGTKYLECAAGDSQSMGVGLSGTTGNWVVEMQFTLDQAASDITFDIWCGNTDNTSTTNLLGYKLFAYQNEEYFVADQTFAEDGNFRFTSGVYSNESFTISGAFPSGTYYLYIFHSGPASAGWSTILASKTTASYVEVSGVCHIGNGSEMVAYQAYIGNGESWELAIPYVGNGSDWDLCS